MLLDFARIRHVDVPSLCVCVYVCASLFFHWSFGNRSSAFTIIALATCSQGEVVHGQVVCMLEPSVFFVLIRRLTFVLA